MIKNIFYLLLFVNTTLLNAQVIKEGTKARVEKQEGNYNLYFNNKPYFIKGACFGGTNKNNLIFISTKGANSICINANEIDIYILEAIKLKLTVMVNLPVASEFTQNFNYNDPIAIKKQFDENKTIVTKYKNNPYILFWGIGNELSKFYKNKEVWKAVNELSKMIHEVSPNHLTVTTIGCPINAELINELNNNCTDIDVLGINCFTGIEKVADALKSYNYQKPYIYTQWGGVAITEAVKNKWQLPIEESSSAKARIYKWQYENAIYNNTNTCLGAFVYYWGQKQNYTPTWHSMFLESGQQLEVIDVMEYIWKGKWPVQRAPSIDSVWIDGLRPEKDIDLYPGTKHDVEFILKPNNNKNIRVDWRTYPEPLNYNFNAENTENKPVETIVKYEKVTNKNRTIFTAPSFEGNYRLFVTVYGDNNKAAVGNIPFHVKKQR